MANEIKTALEKLDVANDNHWTADGAPRLDTVQFLTGNPTLTREAITTAVPGFSRATVAQALAAPVVAATPTPIAPTVAPAVVAAVPAPVVLEPILDTSDADNQDDLLPPVVSEPSSVGEKISNDIAKLKQACAEANEELEDLRKDKDKVTRFFDAKQAEVDRMQEQLDKLLPADDTSNAIQGYLAQQKNLLNIRAQKAAAWKQSGINLKDILPGIAPIDASMKRKTGRGLTRPGSR